MNRLLYIVCFLAIGIIRAQPPRLMLTRGNFDAVTYTIPNTDAKKFLELTKAWVGGLNHKGQKFDVSNVTSNSLEITGYRKNAFFYRNYGETFMHRVKLVMRIEFTATQYTLKLEIPEIYADGDSPIQYTLPDYFSSGGELKEGYEGLTESIQNSMNDIALNYYGYMSGYQ